MRIVTKTLLAGIGCVAAMALAPSADAAELITNGSFEAPGGAAQNYGVSSELGTHDYVAPSFGNADPAGWDRSDPSTGSRIWYVTDAGDAEFPDGDFAVRIDSAHGAPNSSIDAHVDVLSQGGLNLVAGQQYQLTFSYWGEGTTGELLDVDLSGASSVSLFDDLAASVNDNAVDSISTTFTVNVTGVYSIEFHSGGDEVNRLDNNHAWIDNVSLQDVPEPGSLALLGLGGLMVARRRRG